MIEQPSEAKGARRHFCAHFTTWRDVHAAVIEQQGQRTFVCLPFCLPACLPGCLSVYLKDIPQMYTGYNIKAAARHVHAQASVRIPACTCLGTGCTHMHTFYAANYACHSRPGDLSDGNHTLAAAVIVEDNTKQHCSSKAGQDCGPRSDEEAKKLTHPTSRHCLDCQGMVHGYVGVWSVKLHGSISCGMHAPQASVSVVHTGLPPSRQAVPC